MYEDVNIDRILRRRLSFARAELDRLTAEPRVLALPSTPEKIKVVHAVIKELEIIQSIFDVERGIPPKYLPSLSERMRPGKS